ncbi:MULTISPECIES: hypothetical protein [unclassified Sphingomonas]|uniref:hypothetical protein n=1 Tax=unclassified Sphingomonas TaxID=196159 RepID=UPI00226AD676|nr:MULTISPECIES: hypothetical protein [unclassified Sphingomonas]
MPALPADIGAASRDVATATWADPAIAARYPGAKDGSVTPSEGFFDDIADAQAVINVRAALIGTERRRFTAIAEEVVWPDMAAGLPQVLLIDSEQAVNAGFLGARLELDLDADTTTYELFG